MFYFLQILDLFSLKTSQKKPLSIYYSIDFLQILCVMAEIFSNPEDMQSYLLPDLKLTFWCICEPKIWTNPYLDYDSLRPSATACDAML